MSFLDILIGIPLIWGLIKGLNKGLFASLASLVALVVGIYIAVHFSYVIGGYLEKHTSWPEGVMKLVAFAITFILIIILVSFAGKIATKIVDYAALGIVNKILGGVFGVLKMAFIVSVLIIFIDAINRSITILKKETLESSILYGPVRKIAPAILPNILKKESAKEDDNTYYDI